MKTHKDLDVWKNSISLVKDIYCLTKEFPDFELYGIVSQLRRASVSIPTNIAEGLCRNYNKEKIQFFIYHEVVCLKWRHYLLFQRSYLI